MIELHQEVQDMILIERGSCNLYGYTQSEDQTEVVKILVVKLPE